MSTDISFSVNTSVGEFCFTLERVANSLNDACNSMLELQKSIDAELFKVNEDWMNSMKLPRKKKKKVRKSIIARGHLLLLLRL